MFEIIIALLLTFGGSIGVDTKVPKAHFDGDLTFTPNRDDYVVINVLRNADEEEKVVIWTSGHILPSAEYCSPTLISGHLLIEDADPFMVVCTYYPASGGSTKYWVSDLYWPEDFEERGTNCDFYCTNDF